VSSAAGSGPLPPYHQSPLDFDAMLEQYEVLRLRAVYKPKTVYEHRRVLKKAWKLSKEGLLTKNAQLQAVALCRHLQTGQRPRREQEAAAIIEAFVRWYRRP